MNLATKILECYFFDVFICHLFQNPEITRGIKKTMPFFNFEARFMFRDKN